MKILIENKANLEAQDEHGFTALHYCSGNGNFANSESVRNTKLRFDNSNYL